MNVLEKSSLNKRSLNVLIMFFSFLLLPFSGVVIHSTHEVSEGEPLRHFAMSVHNLSAIIFLCSCMLHLFANRKALAKYLSEKTTEYSGFKREAVLALLFVLVLVGLFSSHAFHVR
jgi:cytochrome b subunit of formate dehydrogenase